MQFETRYTYDFVRRFLPRGCRRILEVGCGTGELAARLSKDGYVVIAIDSDRDSVAAARRLGVNAHVATWPDFDQGQFDAVLFTRSLHHIHPLGESVRHAADCLANGGRIIVEDLAYESADEQTLRWFKSVIHLLEATSALVMSDEFLDKVLSKTETLTTWRENHERELHKAVEIDAQLEKMLGASLERTQRIIFGTSPTRSLRPNATRSFKPLPHRRKTWQRTVRSRHWVGGLSLSGK